MSYSLWLGLGLCGGGLPKFLLYCLVWLVGRAATGSKLCLLLSWDILLFLLSDLAWLTGSRSSPELLRSLTPLTCDSRPGLPRTEPEPEAPLLLLKPKD